MMKRLQILLSLVISVICLYFSFRGINWAETLRAMLHANYVLIAGTILVTLVSVWLRAYRWKFMLDPIKRVPVSDLYSSTMIGFMANNILPARLGEFVRAYAIGHTARVSKSAAFATIVIERAFDMVSLVFFLGVVLLIHPIARPVKIAGAAAIAICAIMFMVLILFRARRDLVVRLFHFATARMPDTARGKGERLLHSFIDGLEVLARGHHIAAILALSLVMWLTVAFSMHLGLLAFALAVPIHASLVLLVVVSLALMIPSGPGFAGTFEAAVIGTLLLMNIDQERAASYAIMYHATQFVPITLIGFYYLWKAKLTLGSFTRGGDDSRDDSGESPGPGPSITRTSSPEAAGGRHPGTSG